MNCGAQLDDDAVFCGECGTKVVHSSAPIETKEFQHPNDVQSPQAMQTKSSQQTLQQPYQQGYPQQQAQFGNPQMSQPKFIQPVYPTGTPLLTIVWNGAEGSWDAAQNWLNKKLTKGWKVNNNIVILVNGNPIAPEGVINYYEAIEIKVPFVQGKNTLEIRKGINNRGEVFEFMLDTTQCYRLEIVESGVLANSRIFGCVLYDVSGQPLQEFGLAPANKQWMSILIPFLGAYYGLCDEQAKQSKTVKNLYLLLCLGNILFIGLLLLIIFD